MIRFLLLLALFFSIQAFGHWENVPAAQQLVTLRKELKDLQAQLKSLNDEIQSIEDDLAIVRNSDIPDKAQELEAILARKSRAIDQRDDTITNRGELETRITEINRVLEPVLVEISTKSTEKPFTFPSAFYIYPGHFNEELRAQIQIVFKKWSIIISDVSGRNFQFIYGSQVPQDVSANNDRFTVVYRDEDGKDIETQEFLKRLLGGASSETTSQPIQRVGTLEDPLQERAVFRFFQGPDVSIPNKLPPRPETERPLGTRLEQDIERRCWVTIISRSVGRMIGVEYSTRPGAVMFRPKELDRKYCQLQYPQAADREAFRRFYQQNGQWINFEPEVD